ncbi:MAG TPA: hypothetical protein VKB56_08420 [Terriglobales bacterium]|nr:hypothetical protein [Terriglobales bacterium]
MRSSRAHAIVAQLSEESEWERSGPMEGSGVFGANHHGFRVLKVASPVLGAWGACVCELPLTAVHPNNESGVEA